MLWTTPLPDEEHPEVVSFEDGTTFEGNDLDDCVVGGLHMRQPGPLVNGYISRDSTVSPITEAEAKAELDDQMVHRARPRLALPNLPGQQICPPNGKALR